MGTATGQRYPSNESTSPGQSSGSEVRYANTGRCETLMIFLPRQIARLDGVMANSSIDPSYISANNQITSAGAPRVPSTLEQGPLVATLSSKPSKVESFPTGSLRVLLITSTVSYTGGLGKAWGC